MFGRRIFLLGAAYFMVGFTRPSGAAESRTLVAFFSRLPEMPFGADAVTHATASTGNVEEAAKTIGTLTGADLVSALGWCVLPYLPGDAVKIVLAAMLTIQLDKRLKGSLV